jgi:RNA-directed DNA polymerase
VTPYERLRRRAVLRAAWAKVRENGLTSESSQTKQDILLFEKDWPSRLDKIQHQLKRREFVFSGEKGVPLSKERGKSGVRPIVLAPIANRVVRRAILEVLQGYGNANDPPRRRWEGIPKVRAVMSTPTSIGGIPERGVPHGLALSEQAVIDSRSHFVRSDIKDFFTKIPKAAVSEFIREAVGDNLFANIFDSALATNLENQVELEERNQFKHFPNPEIGVAQGSALSALAGNIVLCEFDKTMNGRGIVCVRYIDDFILLGDSQARVRTAFNSARKLLAQMDMNAYELTDDDALAKGKVDSGNIFNGTDILGYRISGGSLQPSEASRKRLLKKLDTVVADAERQMRASIDCAPASHSLRYHQAVIALHEIIWGWSQSFKYTTALHTFQSLDIEIEKRLTRLKHIAFRLSGSGSFVVKRRVAGIHLLADTPLAALKMNCQGDDGKAGTKVVVRRSKAEAQAL